MQFSKVFLLFYGLIICQSLDAQEGITWWRNNGLQGSAVRPDSNIVVFVSFISESGTGWSKEEMQKSYNRVVEAMGWIAAQGKKYNVNLQGSVNLMNGDKEMKFNLIPDNIKANPAEKEYMAYNIVKQMGFENSLHFGRTAIQNIPQMSDMILVIFAKKRGAPYAVKYRGGDGLFSTHDQPEKKFLEHVLIYDNPTEKADPVVLIAHEVLHLFGANDMYLDRDFSREQVVVAGKYLPKSIMMGIEPDKYKPISEYEIDEYTSWILGWNNTSKPWYFKLRPGDTLRSKLY